MADRKAIEQLADAQVERLYRAVEGKKGKDAGADLRSLSWRGEWAAGPVPVRCLSRPMPARPPARALCRTLLGFACVATPLFESAVALR
eukprot:CAMPEP_0175367686 /NCGR_PEP_ID=MMETSP0095-20121207/19790_1 /TAXON_ID=311494 /ORGANISM="Alexandrium monilatum, Strain CCMP3105" /LENGTH=88 /DNA_ID=CAMNT_0016665751 /DNA_START=85 /DNA_END=349 /DNA_ORIENTATION=+